METVQSFSHQAFLPYPLVYPFHIPEASKATTKEANKETQGTGRLSSAASFDHRGSQQLPFLSGFMGLDIFYGCEKKIRHAPVLAVPECKTRIYQGPINQPVALLQRCTLFSKALMRTEGPPACQCLHVAAEAEG